MSMNVVKRNGTSEEVSFDKIYKRIKYLVAEPSVLSNINTHTIAQNVIQGLYDGMNTTEIDTYSANVSASLSVKNYEYGILTGRISLNNHQKNTLTGFKDKVDKLYLRKDHQGETCPIVSTNFYKYVKKNQKSIEQHIDYNKDYSFDFFGFKTLEKSYLLQIDGEIVERPQDLWMRVAIFIHMTKNWKCPKTLEKIFETYDLLSGKYFTHATPTLFNAGLVKPSLLSCFLVGTGDSLEEIMHTATDCANISKWSGGIGFHISNWRANDSLIRGTGGKSSGIVPFLRIFNDVARAFNQGGRRMGSFAVYLEPHHADIMAFLELRKNHGDENLRARDLFLALWVSDLFMNRVKNDKDWSVFCPDECPGLSETYGDEYEKLYMEYESKGMAKHTYRARDIWKAIYMSQKESGLPYMCYKDQVNKCSNHKNLGVIKSSNLCSEILEYSSSKEYACCVLASICLPMFVEDTYAPDEDPESRQLNHEFPTHPVFNYTKFEQVVEVITRNLNKIIDNNYYPVPETKRSNIRHRPLGIGVQGLADVFFKFNIAFDSEPAKKLNRYIFETLYYAAVSASTKIAREIYMEHRNECMENGKVIHQKTEYTDNGKSYTIKTEYTDTNDIPSTIGAYPSYLENGGSPISNGIFHFEMAGLTTDDLETSFDWESLRAHINKFGIRNSLLIALMPTASTSQIMGNTEGMEPLTSNIYKRQTLAGEFIVINKYLMQDLNTLGLWSPEMENWIKFNNGSIQNIEGIPEHVKSKYKTVWELSQKTLIDLAADRQYFVDQSQSLNLYIEDLTFSKFNSMHFYGWGKGLKTGSYYIRSRAAVTAQKFTVDESKLVSLENVVEPVGPTEACLVCSS